VKAAAVRELALALPEASEAPHFQAASFRIGGKIFADLPPGETTLHVFVGEELRAPLIAAHPDCYAALHWGKKVVGLAVTLAGADPATVRRLLLAAWRARAPKRLAEGLSPE
jgi:hypothetical protein